MTVNASAKRLAEALQLLDPAGRIDPTYMAARLNESPQVITNWRSRGVSKDGAIAAQRKLGVSCTWVLDGLEPKLLGQSQAARLTGSMIQQAFREAALFAAQGGAESGDFDPAQNDDDAGILAVVLNRALSPSHRQDSVTVEVGNGSSRRTGNLGSRQDTQEVGGESEPEAGQHGKRASAGRRSA